MKTYTLEVAVDTEDGENFVNWLISKGHTAILGKSTGNFVDGLSTSVETEENEIMSNLWETFCNH